MKISGYSSVVGPASPMHGSMKVSSDPMAYGGGSDYSNHR